MISVMYKVVFEGDLLPGYQQADVQDKLADLFHLERKAAGKLFSGKEHKVKSKLNLKRAKKYAKALAKLGALAIVEQEMIEQEHPFIESQQDKFTETGSFDMAAVRMLFEEEQEKRRKKEKSDRHELFELDSFDDELVSYQDSVNGDLSGVQNILSAEQIAKMLGKKSGG